MRLNDAYFEITNLCNLNCVTCYNRSGLNHIRQELSLSQLTGIIERLAAEFDCTAFSIAGGEPLLYSQLDELLIYIKRHPDFRFSFVTNGTVHNESFIAMIQEDPARFRVQISLDGSCEEINARTRGQGSFEQALQFVDRLSSPLFRPLLKMVISQNNCDDVEPFFHLAAAHGCLPVFDFVTNSGNASDRWDSISLSPKQKLHVNQTIQRLNQQYPECSTGIPFSGGACPLCDRDHPTTALIKTDGTMFPCQLLYDNDYSCGNILTDSTDTIVAGLRRLQDIAIARKAQDYHCSRCPLREKCSHGCLAAALNGCGDPLADDGSCQTRRLEFIQFELLPGLNSQ